MLAGFRVNDAEGDDLRVALCQKTARVLDRIAVGALLVTRGEQGMTLVEREQGLR